VVSPIFGDSGGSFIKTGADDDFVPISGHMACPEREDTEEGLCSGSHGCKINKFKC